MAATVGFTSCDDYLDKLPDNRMELSSPSDVSKLLVNAYSETNPAYLLEMYLHIKNYVIMSEKNRKKVKSICGIK